MTVFVTKQTEVERRFEKWVVNMLSKEQQTVVEDRLVSLEDMLRDMIIIHNAQVLAATNQKIALTANGLEFRYQQGILDMCEQVGRVLEGNTHYFEFTNAVKAEVIKERQQETSGVDVV